MVVRPRKLAWIVSLAAGCILSAATADACDVPVFRYALERWPAFPYGVLVFHRGELPPAEKAVVDWLGKCASGEKLACNVMVRAVDVSGKMPPQIAAIWKTQAGAKLPWMVVLYPVRGPARGVAWAAPLTARNVAAAVDSPIRQEVIKRILDGESGVWVFLGCGDPAKDEPAAKLLATELKKLRGMLELPTPASFGWGPPVEGAPTPPKLRVAFSLIRLSRKDKAERAFVQMLLRTEEDLIKEYSDQPMAFAIYGRGRALFALVGKGITAENIGGMCEFLVGRCTCDIRDWITGTDLLMAADWDARLEEQFAQTAPELPDAVAPATKAAATQPAATQPAAAQRVAAGGLGLFVWSILIAFGFIAVGAVVLVLWLSKAPSRS